MLTPKTFEVFLMSTFKLLVVNCVQAMIPVTVKEFMVQETERGKKRLTMAPRGAT